MGAYKAPAGKTFIPAQRGNAFVTTKPKLSWDTGETFDDNIAEDCSCKSLPKPTIYICPEVKGVFETLRKEIEVEWQVFLVGSISDNHHITITGYHVPKQKVTGSTVECLECVDQQFITEKGVVASIHSHSDMGVFFSGTDDKANCSLIKAHIVTNNKREYVGVYRHTIPCGMEKFIDLNIVNQQEPITVVQGMDRIDQASGFQGFHNQHGYGLEDDDYVFDQKSGCYVPRADASDPVEENWWEKEDLTKDGLSKEDAELLGVQEV